MKRVLIFFLGHPKVQTQTQMISQKNNKMRPQILFLAVAEICCQKTNYIASFGKMKFQMKPKTLIFTTSITKMLGHSPMCSETKKKKRKEKKIVWNSNF